MGGEGPNGKRRGTPISDKDRYDRWSVRIRDTIIFGIGSLGVLNEMFLVEEPRPSMLIFIGSLLGLPIVLGADERRASRDDHSTGEGGQR